MRARIFGVLLGLALGCTKKAEPVQPPPPKVLTHTPTAAPILQSFSLKPFRIQLPGMRPQFVRLELVLQHHDNPEIKKELDKRQPQIRNIVLFTVQKKTRAFLLARDGQEALRKELRIAINQVMRRKIEEVLITEILVQ